jgi:nucleotide-binding universal stress UspA family protein
VLLAADATPSDRATVDRAISIAVKEHATLVALVVLAGDHGSQLRDTDGPVPSELERIVNRARRAGVEARHLVRFGDVGREILRTARELDADLIVVGSSPGCGHVLAHGDRPILVVHPWADVGPGWEETISQPPSSEQPGVGLAGGADADVRQIPIRADRVACPLLGDVDLDRCRECDHLIRVESAAGTAERTVVCIDRGKDYGDNLAW